VAFVPVGGRAGVEQDQPRAGAARPAATVTSTAALSRRAGSATYHCAGVRTLFSTNARDFSIFGCFDVVSA
jgi:hypothetical protein